MDARYLARNGSFHIGANNHTSRLINEFYALITPESVKEKEQYLSMHSSKTAKAVNYPVILTAVLLTAQLFSASSSTFHGPISMNEDVEAGYSPLMHPSKAPDYKKTDKYKVGYRYSRNFSDVIDGKRSQKDSSNRDRDEEYDGIHPYMIEWNVANPVVRSPEYSAGTPRCLKETKPGNYYSTLTSMEKRWVFLITGVVLLFVLLGICASVF